MRAVRILGAATIVGALLAGRRGARLPAQGVPPPAAVVDAAADATAAARAQRLAIERARCDTLMVAGDRFGHVDGFTTAARRLLGQVTNRFVNVGDGVFTDVALKNWLEWNVSREGGPVLPTLDTRSLEHPFRAIVELNRELHAHGIDFLLVTLPTRPALYPELAMELPSMEGFAGFCPATPRFVRALLDADVEVLYLATEFVAQRYGEGGDRSDQLFLRYNQHWAPRGAELAARMVSERVALYPWFAHGPAKEGVDFTTQQKRVNVSVVWGGTPEGAKPEPCLATQVIPKPGRRLDSVRPSSSIVLLSGSFGDFHVSSQCDFTSQLYRHTGWPVDKINPKGGIEDACREELGRKSESDWKRKKLVIWLVAEQAFVNGPQWRPIPIWKE